MSEIKPTYYDLTADNNADKNGHYSHALESALDNKNVMNIALTGPYGSGKSSVIKTFKQSDDGQKYKFLDISLAAFCESDGEKGTAQDHLIEQSILQQIIYKVSHKNLPLSRFKKIAMDEKEYLKSVIFTTWLCTAVISFFILNGINYNNILLNIGEWEWGLKFCLNIQSSFLVYFLAGAVLYVKDTYCFFCRSSLHKINFKSGEIELSEDSEHSILNKHFDEILYFFQSNTFDVVVIEDLDRFGTTDIFVKLREINNLLNNSDEVKQDVRFLYAIKDDMFLNKERTKFFDFILPVIPVINSSNSNEKFKAKLLSTPYGNDIEKQFLKEVSIYIDDMRLLTNIVNEMNIYYVHLALDEQFNATNLLALLIYKNSYPVDFEKLHHNEGLLFEACNSRNSLIKLKSEHFKNEIDTVSKNLIEVEKKVASERAKNISDLRLIYLHKIQELFIDKYPDFKDLQILINDRWQKFFLVRDNDLFASLMDSKTLKLKAVVFNRWADYELKLSDLETAVNSLNTYQERKGIIDLEYRNKIREFEDKLTNLKVQKSKITTWPLFKLLVDSEYLSNFKDNKNEKFALARYLLRNNYINEHYRDFISHFYAGSLTNNDMSFIRAIRDFKVMPYDHELTNVEDVIEQLRDSDFLSKNIFNISLVNYLLHSDVKYSKNMNNLMLTLKNNYQYLWLFIEEYHLLGSQVTYFVKALAGNWPEYGQTVVVSNYLSHSIKVNFMSSILSCIDGGYIKNEMNLDNCLSEFISNNPESIINIEKTTIIDNAVINTLSDIGVKFKSISLLDDDKVLYKSIYENHLYEINSENIELILRKESNLDLQKINESNLTIIYNSTQDFLIENIETNITKYLSNIFLNLSTNTKESKDTILNLLNNQDIALEFKKQILALQDFIFDDLTEVDEEHWSSLLILNKVKINWENLINYLGYVEYFDAVLKELLGKIDNIQSLEKINIEGKEDLCHQMINGFILDNEFNDDIYSELIKTIPWDYESLDFSNLSDSKIDILINNNLLILSPENYDLLNRSHNEYVKILLLNNLNAYFANSHLYELTHSDMMYLIANVNKACQKMALLHIACSDDFLIHKDETSQLFYNSVVSALNNIAELNDFDISAILLAINSSNVTNEKIELFVKVGNIFDVSLENIKEFVELLGGEYSDVVTYRKRPKIKNNAINQSLANFLLNKGAISQVQNDKGMIRIVTKKV